MLYTITRCTTVCKSSLELQDTLKFKLVKVGTWLKCNKLSLNIRNTNDIFFYSNKKAAQPPISLSISAWFWEYILMRFYISNVIIFFKRWPGKICRSLFQVVTLGHILLRPHMFQHHSEKIQKKQRKRLECIRACRFFSWQWNDQCDILFLGRCCVVLTVCVFGLLPVMQLLPSEKL